MNLRGPVVSTFYAVESNGQPTFINIGRPHPDPGRVTAVIFDDDRGEFPDPPERAFDGETVCVRGQLELYEGVPEIIVDSPDDIRIL